MSWLSELWRKAPYLFHRGRLDRDLAEEMRLHVEMKAQKLTETGLASEEAHYRARREFGNAALLKETSREMWGWRPLEELGQDLRYALRTLRRSPGFTAIALVTLALGIGANTAIFSLVNAVLLRPLPYRDPDRLVMLWEWNLRQSHINTVTFANYADWKSRNHVFEDMGYSWDNGFTITGSGNPESVPGYMFSTNIFPLLGTKPLLGRIFLADEGQPGKDHVVVLSYKLWQRRFASDPGALGRRIRLNWEDYTIVGVMPPDFSHPGGITDLWAPLEIPPANFSDRNNHALRVVARLRPGVGQQQAQAELDGITRELAREHPDTNEGMGARLWPIRDLYVGDVRQSLLVLQMAVLLMLMIACGNVASLLLARASAREREVAIRLAMGAGKPRLVRQFVTEGLVLATLGGMGGLILALWGAGLLPALLPDAATLPDAAHQVALLNTPVLLFTLLLSMVAGVVFGCAPGFRSTASANESLKEGGRSSTGGVGRVRVRAVLTVSQIALSLMLLVGAGLMVRSFLRLQSRQLGFRADHLLTVQTAQPPNPDFDEKKKSALIRQTLARVESLPGVESAGAINTLPLSGAYARRNFTLPGQPALPFGQQNNGEFRLVTPNYFHAMGIPLLRGRYFNEGDRAGSAGVAIVNETMARRFWPDEDPIGKRITVADGGTTETREIVGVVGDTRHHGLAVDPDPEIYRPFYQAYWPFFSIVVHTSSDPLGLAGAVRGAIWSVDKDQPINAVRSMEQLAVTSLATRRTSTVLLAAFAGIALLLAAIGIYGVLAYLVNERTHEIGIRMALGAQQRDVLGMVLGRAGLLAASGIGVGLCGAFAGARFMRSLLYGVSAVDVFTFVAVPVLLGVVALVAAYLPARRASKIDPIVALRYE